MRSVAHRRILQKALRVLLAFRGPGQPEPQFGQGALSRGGGVRARKGGRYHASRMMIADRDKNLRRLRFGETAFGVGREREQGAHSKSAPERALEFVPLSAAKHAARQRKRERDAGSGLGLQPERGRDRSDDSSSSSDGGSDGEEGEGQTFAEYIYEKTRDFNRRTREDPHDVELWFRFLDFQDESVPLHRSGSAAPVLEKKIAILEKALQHNPGHETLLMTYLNTCARHWPPDKMLALWEKTIAEHSHSARLWKVTCSHVVSINLFLSLSFSLCCIASVALMGVARDWRC